MTELFWTVVIAICYLCVAALTARVLCKAWYVYRDVAIFAGAAWGPVLVLVTTILVCGSILWFFVRCINLARNVYETSLKPKEWRWTPQLWSSPSAPSA